MLRNEYLVAKIGVDTAENEPSKASGEGAVSFTVGFTYGSYRPWVE